MYKIIFTEHRENKYSYWVKKGDKTLCSGGLNSNQAKSRAEAEGMMFSEIEWRCPEVVNNDYDAFWVE